MSSRTFDHAFTIAFSLRSHEPDEESIMPAQLRRAILTRLAALDDSELLEAIGLPFDTYVVDETLVDGTTNPEGEPS